MIKLIATDMDGTFLDSQKNFDLDFIHTYRHMQDNNIKFVIASGNQYQRLFQKFLPMSMNMIFIAENGSYIAEGTNELYTNTLTPKD
ncbi:MAG: HAD hydrolase family protein, partial [Coprobacillus sp.]